MQHGEIPTVMAVDPPKWWEPPSDRLIDGRLRTNRVVGTSERIGYVVLDLSIGGETITTTPGHLFYSASRRRYLPAEELEIGELLETCKGGTVALDSKSAPRYGLLKLYNIEVEPNHNFFVGKGETAVRVHNGIPGAAGSGIPLPAEPLTSSDTEYFLEDTTLPSPKKDVNPYGDPHQIPEDHALPEKLRDINIAMHRDKLGAILSANEGIDPKRIELAIALADLASRAESNATRTLSP